MYRILPIKRMVRGEVGNLTYNLLFQVCGWCNI